MGIGNLNASDIVAFAAREGNKMIEAQVNMKAKLFAALDKQPMKGRRSVINVVNGGLASTSQVVDFGALPSEAASVPAQGFVDAVGYVSRLGLGRIALETLAGVDDSADLLDLQLQLAADDMARQIGRATFGSVLSSPTNSGGFTGAGRVTQAGGGLTTTTITAQFVGGIADFREGEAYIYEPEIGTGGAGDHIAAPGVFHVLCTNVALISDNVVQVTFIAGPGGVPGFDTGAIADSLLTTCGGTVVAAPGPSTAGRVGNTANNALVTTDGFFLRGSRLLGVTGASRGPSGASAVSLLDITNPSTALHGLSAGVNGWSGITFGSVGAATPEMFMAKSRLLQARAGVAATHLVMSDIASVAYASAQISNGSSGTAGYVVQGRRNVDGKLDRYGKDGDMDSGLAFFGRPVLTDSNCPATTAFMINKDYLKVGEWKKLSAEDEGGSPLLLSRSTYSKEVQFSCIYNLVCRKRNAHAQLSGITLL
jgi:hypothetical protein